MNFVFEFDEAKSATNKEKHGIDFIEAQALWNDDDMIIGSARPVEEPRWLAVAKIKGRLWTACITMRDKSIRIISVRRARSGEEKIYESQRV